MATGPSDDPVKINSALAELQGETRTLLVRGYVHYTGSAMRSDEGDTPHPQDVMQYAIDGRKLDLVINFRDPNGDLAGWLNFIRATVRRCGSQLTQLQITEEPNLTDAPGSADGCMPDVQQALIQGVVAAKGEAHRQGLNIQVGFNAVPSFNPNDDFWLSIARQSDQSFIDALDYVGLDFFPDVFRPIEPKGSLDALRQAVVGVLTHFRQVNLTAGNFPQTIPMHITENGWPTGPTRSYERQAEVLETVIRTVYEQRTNLNITRYELFALRDADSSNTDLFYQFGLLRDDYTPKPAFESYRRMIAELSE